MTSRPRSRAASAFRDRHRRRDQERGKRRPGWVDFDADGAIERVLTGPVHLVNDADAAGVAEMRFGAGVGERGTVFLITLGTGTGSALFFNGMLVPNLELGHMEIAAVTPSGARSPRRGSAGLRWKAWARTSTSTCWRSRSCSARTVHHRRRRPSARTVDPAADRARRGGPGRLLNDAGRRCGDRGGRGRADIDGRVTTDHARPMAVAVTRMVIGGRPADAADGRTFEVVEPHRGTVGRHVSAGRERRTSIARSRRPRRRSTASGARWRPQIEGDCCCDSPRSVRAHEEELSALESRQIGKPISGARWEVGQVSRVLEFYAGATTKLRGSTIPVTRPGLDFTLRQPMGVVASHRAVEFPVSHRLLEGGPGAGGRQTVSCSSPLRSRR